MRCCNSIGNGNANVVASSSYIKQWKWHSNSYSILLFSFKFEPWYLPHVRQCLAITQDWNAICNKEKPWYRMAILYPMVFFGSLILCSVFFFLSVCWCENQSTLMLSQSNKYCIGAWNGFEWGPWSSVIPFWENVHLIEINMNDLLGKAPVQ